MNDAQKIIKEFSDRFRVETRRTIPLTSTHGERVLSFRQIDTARTRVRRDMEKEYKPITK